MDPQALKPICELWVVIKPDGSLKHRAGFDSAREADSFASDVYGMANQSPRIEPRRVVCIDAEEWEKAVSPQRAQGAQSGEADLVARNRDEDAKACGLITYEEALQIAQRFVDGHFKNAGKEGPRISIPADTRRDDDIRLMAFIQQQQWAGTMRKDVSRPGEIVMMDCSPQHAAPSTQHRSAYELTGETSLKSVMAKAGVLP